MKVLFMLEQPLFTELRYLALFWRYRNLKFDGRTSLYRKIKVQIWTKINLFGLYFSIFIFKRSEIDFNDQTQSVLVQKSFWVVSHCKILKFLGQNAIFWKTRKTIRLLQKSCLEAEIWLRGSSQWSLQLIGSNFWFFLKMWPFSSNFRTKL